MPRRVLATLLFLFATSTLAASAEELCPPDGPCGPNPMHRVNAWTEGNPGERETIILQYGPYVVGPGSDLSRVDFEVNVGNGFVIGARPSVRYADGTEPPDDVVHIHHAHWVRIKDPQEWPRNGSRDYNDYVAWFFGTGEEKTRGRLEPVWGADPRSNPLDSTKPKLRYGGETRRGEKLAFISMLHNKTSAPLVVWLEGRFDVVHGMRAEILDATGEDFHPLTPVLHGTTFQVPRAGGLYSWPHDLGDEKAAWIQRGAPSGEVVPGVGHVWTSPFDGTIIIGAGHLHPGGRVVTVSNLGSIASPCGGAFGSDSDGDGFAGKAILRINAYYQDDIFPSEGFQMGITQHAWRAKVRVGDVIAINGTYDTTNYAYPDAMSFFGFFTDPSEPPASPEEECWAGLLGDSVVDPGDLESMMNRGWEAHTGEICDPCDNFATAKQKGTTHLDAIHMADFIYVPGDQKSSGGAPWVTRGEKVPVYNEDWALGLVRHSITTCAWPCNGPYSLNYPFHDGVLDSGAIGYTPIDTYQKKEDVPMWTLDTSGLTPGPYAYYCRLHPNMRGAFYVEA